MEVSALKDILSAVAEASGPSPASESPQAPEEAAKEAVEEPPEEPEKPLLQIPDNMMDQMMSAWGRKPEFYCDICEIECKSEEPYKKHLTGKQHKKKEASRSKFVRGDEDVTTAVELNFSLLGQPVVGLECMQVNKNHKGISSIFSAFSSSNFGRMG